MKRGRFILFPPLSTTVPSSYKLLCRTKLARLVQWSNSNQQFVSLYDREHSWSNGNVFIPLPLIETLPRKEQKLTFCDKHTAQQGEHICSRSSAYKLAVRKEKTSMWPHSSGRGSLVDRQIRRTNWQRRGREFILRGKRGDTTTNAAAISRESPESSRNFAITPARCAL